MGSFPETCIDPHPHIRTLILEFRLIIFLFTWCLVRNQPESVLKLFLKIVLEIVHIIHVHVHHKEV